MERTTERNWTAQLVIDCDHAGLKPHFRELEYEMYHVLARVDDPQKLALWVAKLISESRRWLHEYQRLAAEK